MTTPCSPDTWILLNSFDPYYVPSTQATPTAKLSVIPLSDSLPTTATLVDIGGFEPENPKSPSPPSKKCIIPVTQASFSQDESASPRHLLFPLPLTASESSLKNWQEPEVLSTLIDVTLQRDKVIRTLQDHVEKLEVQVKVLQEESVSKEDLNRTLDKKNTASQNSRSKAGRKKISPLPRVNRFGTGGTTTGLATELEALYPQTTPCSSNVALDLRQDEIISETQRVHWSCAGLDIDTSYTPETYVCPECSFILATAPYSNIAFAQQERCVRPDCILHMHKAPQVRDGDDERFRMERIIGRRELPRADPSSTKKFEYLVKWEDWEINDCTWEPADNIDNLEMHLGEFKEVCDHEDLDYRLPVVLLSEARSAWNETGILLSRTRPYSQGGVGVD
ncbi:hypothetical protein BCR39DRAFT_586415 [Naematelia encephala]|uniref:Chromo domain-containing protein n=1 Tax=Naematelia encephala TaxID=71784 RepID=A0A1Y2BGU1_9TREE|nr:hypothetical protein BCR39DRAFT_586415 [Naematelia encephala]